MSYRIASFNVRDFAFPGKDIGDISRGEIIAKNVANIIKNNNIDVIALQELQNQQAMNHILHHLNYTLRDEEQYQDTAENFKWRGSFRMSTTKLSYREGYCYIWNSKRLILVEKKRNGKELDNPRLINKKKEFVRPPLYIRFIPADFKVNLEIRLVNIHIRFGKSANEKDVDKITESDVILRRKEFQSLLKLFEKGEIDSPEDGTNRIPYTVILGDYNLCLRASGVAPHFESQLERSKKLKDEGKAINREKYEIKGNGQNSKKLKDKGKAINREKYESNGNGQNSKKCIVTKQTNLSTLKDPSRRKDKKEHYTKNIFSHNYDHFTLDTIRYGHVYANEIKVINTKDGLPILCDNKLNELYAWDDVKSYRQNVSDHLPIVFDFTPKELANKEEKIKNV